MPVIALYNTVPRNASLLVAVLSLASCSLAYSRATTRLRAPHLTLTRDDAFLIDTHGGAEMPAVLF